jgi:hypothetical protein
MLTEQDNLFEEITERLPMLKDKQLTNLIEVIRVIQGEREEEKVLSTVI